MEFGSQRLNDLLPIHMGCQTSSRCATNAMLAIQLNIQGIKGVGSRTNCDPNRVCVLCDILNTWWSLVLGFVELETYLGEIVEFRDSASLDLSRNSALEDTI